MEWWVLDVWVSREKERFPDDSKFSNQLNCINTHEKSAKSITVAGSHIMNSFLKPILYVYSF